MKEGKARELETGSAPRTGSEPIRVLILWNPVAGRDQRKQEEALFSQCPIEWRCEKREAEEPGQIASWAREAEAQGFDMLVVMGGDGSVAEAADGLIRSGADIPLGIIPTGSSNILARSLGYPLDIEEAMRAVVEGSPVALDAGRVLESDRHFLLGMTAGLHADMMRESPRSWKRILGGGVYVLAAARHLFRNGMSRARLETGETVLFARTNMIALLNIGNFVPRLEKIAPRVRSDDGRLDLIVIRRANPLRILWIAFSLIMRRRIGSRRIEHRPVSRLRLSADPPLAVQIDGELMGETPVTIEIIPRAIKVITPPQRS